MRADSIAGNKTAGKGTRERRFAKHHPIIKQTHQSMKATNPLKKLRGCGTMSMGKCIYKAGEIIVRIRK